MAVTILIKRNADRDYDRLFAAIDAIGGHWKADSVKEEETTEGYAVTFKSLNGDVMEWVAKRPKDFAIIEDGDSRP